MRNKYQDIKTKNIKSAKFVQTRVGFKANANKQTLRFERGKSNTILDVTNYCSQVVIRLYIVRRSAVHRNVKRGLSISE